jgi:hypothetical protein
MYLKKLLLSLFFIVPSFLSFAGIVKGRVLDANTGEPLAGATVYLENTKYTAVVNLDGTFTFKNIPAGKYEMKAEVVGYKKSKGADIEVKDGNEIQTVDFNLENESLELKGILVSAGKNRETDKSARTAERKADFVMNVLSQNAIQLSPDVTVANSLQRVSGVTIQRSSAGEGRYAIIRGMDQRYNSTLVNGIKIPSPDDKFRYVPLDLFPSDLLERLEVIKSLTPSMEGDAVGGTMNLVMKNAPNKFIFSAFAAGGYNTLFNDRPFTTFDHSVINKKDPTEIHGPGYVATDADFPRANLALQSKSAPINKQFGFTIGNRFLNKRLGVILGGSYQDNYRGSDNIFNSQNPQAAILPNTPTAGQTAENSPKFDDAYTRQYSTRQRRLAFNNKWDYAFNQNNRLSLFNFYTRMDEFQARYSIDTLISTNIGNVEELYRSRWQIQTIYNSTLQGDHNLSNLLKFNWSAVYSIAKQQIPDQAEFAVDNSISDPTHKHTVKGMSRKWLHNSDQDVSGYLNFIYTPKIHGTDVEFSAGGLFRHKTRDNYYNEYNLSSKGSPSYTNIYDAPYEFNSGGGVGDVGNGNTYTVTENVSAGYIQAKFMASKKLQLLGGARVEHTDDNFNSALPLTTPIGVYGHIWYTDLLPSLHLKYLLNSKQNLRASYFRSLVRPGFFEIAPYYIQNEYYYEQGNPYIKHTTADNLDLRYEYFPNGADQILAGVFYKQIHDPIETGFSRTPTTGGNAGTSTQILTPTNYGDATNYGAEFVITKFFGKIGINANYTYTHSAITTDRSYAYLNPVTARPDVKILSQTRPMQGQANHIGNLSLIFKDPKIGLDVQVAYVYTGERITLVSFYYGLDYWQQPYSQLDLSLEKKIVKHFSFYAKINNLTNSKTNVIIKQPYYPQAFIKQLPGQTDFDKIFAQSDTYKISFLAGIRYKL